NAVTDPGIIQGIVFCRRLGDTDDRSVVQGTVPVDININFGGNTFIPSSQIDDNGTAPFNIHDQIGLFALHGLVNANDVCPPSTLGTTDSSPSSSSTFASTGGWILVDFVPQKFSVSLGASDAMGHLLTLAIYDCEMPWADLRTLHFKEQRPYTCTVRLNR